MTGPWVVTMKDGHDGSFTATVDIGALMDAATKTSFSPEDALGGVKAAWSAALHEGFGPQDFVVHDPDNLLAPAEARDTTGADA